LRLLGPVAEESTSRFYDYLKKINFFIMIRDQFHMIRGQINMTSDHFHLGDKLRSILRGSLDIGMSFIYFNIETNKLLLAQRCRK
jgi:hypothetical protein